MLGTDDVLWVAPFAGAGLFKGVFPPTGFGLFKPLFFVAAVGEAALMLPTPAFVLRQPPLETETLPEECDVISLPASDKISSNFSVFCGSLSFSVEVELLSLPAGLISGV